MAPLADPAEQRLELARARMARGRSTRGSGPRATPAEVAELQTRLLASVLTGVPLPGATEPLSFPDLAFLQRSTPVLLLDRNLAGPLGAGARVVRVLSAAELEREARARPGAAYLEFQAPELGPDAVGLTLHGRVHAPVGHGTLGLSSVHVRFRRVQGRWEAADPPAFSAL